MRNSKGQFIKGYKPAWTAESKRKVSETAEKVGVGKWMLGRKPTAKSRQKMSENSARYWLGKKRPDISGARHWKWKPKLERVKTYGKGRKRPEVTGSNNTEWRGDEVGYHGLHRWIWKHFGKPSQCDHCGITTGKFEWANKTGEYKRNINDWLRLCTKCHGYYDSNKSGIGIRGSSVTRFGKYYK